MDVSDLLACVVLEPRLDGLLFLDVDGRALLSYAEELATLLEEVEGVPRRVVTLGSSTSEEDLWPHWGLWADDGRLTFRRQPGLLSEPAGAAAPLVVVPDLARASRVVARAAVTALGADVVHLERGGISERWQPTARWLAACARRDVPALSAHLLDRFPVRWDGGRPSTPRRPIRDHLGAIIDATTPRTRPGWTDDIVDVLAHADLGTGSIRRALALAAAARAVAERRGAQVVTHEDVRRAGQLLGWAEPVSSDPALSPRSPTAQPPLASQGPERTPHASRYVGAAEDSAGEPELAELSGTSDISPEHRVNLGATEGSYPEDDPEAVPQARSLQWSSTGPVSTDRMTGTVIGHDRATSVRDLAIVPTLFRTLWRTRTHRHTDATMRISRDDLRQHRREQRPQRLLVLVIDHTCRHNWDCWPGLAPHAQWAYDEAATVSVIEFGHRDSLDELRPQRYRARSVVDPRIMESFDRLPGSASALAASIDLAAEELRRFMHRGWASVRAAKLVVITDGRGNVPLAASAEGAITGRVAREGIDDALTAARTIAVLNGVDARVIAPAVQQYRTLPEELAFALGGAVTYVDGDAVTYVDGDAEAP